MKISRFFSVLLASYLLTACTSSNQTALTYFSNIDGISQQIPAGNYNVAIQPSDELLITVTSNHSGASEMFNLPMVNPATKTLLKQMSNARQMTYIVDSKGYINFPVLGEIKAAGLDVEQLREKLTKDISKYVENPYVTVDLVNFYVNVAGEVRTPGRIPVNSTRFSVLDALTAAGDLTAYGLRENVLIVREENGERTFMRLNLNDASTLSSPYYYLKQNDYVYVEPSPVRKDNADYNQNNAFKLSVISTVVSAASVIVSLIIALTR